MKPLGVGQIIMLGFGFLICNGLEGGGIELEG